MEAGGVAGRRKQPAVSRATTPHDERFARMELCYWGGGDTTRRFRGRAARFRYMKRAVWFIIVLTVLPDTVHSETLGRKLT
jgi:hypothetical protein